MRHDLETLNAYSTELSSRERCVRLTRYTDYSLRVLIHLALNDESLCSIGEISLTYDVSHNHLLKVVNALAHDGRSEELRVGKGVSERVDIGGRCIFKKKRERTRMSKYQNHNKKY